MSHDTSCWDTLFATQVKLNESLQMGGTFLWKPFIRKLWIFIRCIFALCTLGLLLWSFIFSEQKGYGDFWFISFSNWCLLLTTLYFVLLVVLTRNINQKYELYDGFGSLEEFNCSKLAQITRFLGGSTICLNMLVVINYWIMKNRNNALDCDKESKENFIWTLNIYQHSISELILLTDFTLSFLLPNYDEVFYSLIVFSTYVICSKIHYAVKLSNNPHCSQKRHYMYYALDCSKDSGLQIGFNVLSSMCLLFFIHMILVIIKRQSIKNWLDVKSNRDEIRKLKLINLQKINERVESETESKNFVTEEILKELEGEKLYVHFGDSWITPFRQIWHFILFIIGAICFLIMMLLWILLIIPALISYMIDLNNHNKHEIYAPTSPTTKACGDYLRFFWGKQRLRLLKIPSDKRDFFWILQDRLIGFYQIGEFILNAKISMDCIIGYWSSLVKEFGENFPCLFGVGTINLERCDDIVSSLHHDTSIRDFNIFSMHVCESAKLFSKLGTIYLSTNSDDHKNSRKIIYAWLKEFNSINRDQYKRNVLQINLEQLIPRNSSVTENEARASIANTVFYSTMGQPLLKHELDAAVEFQTLGAGVNVIPSWMQFILFGYALERKVYNEFETLRQAFIRVAREHPNNKTIRNIIEEARNCKISLNDALRAVTMVFCVAGLGGVEKLTIYALRYLRQDPTYYIPLFMKDSDSFLKESARLNTSPNALTYYLKNDEVIRINNEDVLIHKNTPIIGMQMIINRSPQIHGNNANKFDITRTSLGECTNWNAKTKYFSKSKEELEKNAPRYCIGHSLSLFAAEIVCEQHMPHFNDGEEDDNNNNNNNDNYFVINDKNEKFHLHDIYSTLDDYTKAFMMFAKTAAKKQNSNPPTALDIPMPMSNPNQNDQALVGIFAQYIPTNDEDEPSGTGLFHLLIRKVINNKNIMKFEDISKSWPDIDTAISWKEKHFSYLPPPNIIYEELQSDEAISRLAFCGLGCHYIRRINEIEKKKIINDDEKKINEDEKKITENIIPDNAEFIHDVSSILSQFNVRNSYERYGAIAYFDKEYKIIAIYWCHGEKLVKPNDHDWNHAKWVWKTSVFAFITLIDHLLIVHFTESNALVTSCIESLLPNHWLRIFLKPFTYHTVTVNYQASQSLVSERGVINRLWALEWSEIVKVLRFGTMSYKFTTLPQKCHPSMNNVDDKYFPYIKDCNEFWKVIYKYVDNMVRLYCKKDEDIRKDNLLVNFIRNLSSRLGLNAQKLYTKIDDLVEVLTQLICSVTALHEHVGQVSDYITRPDWTGTRLEKNCENNSIQSYSLLLALTIMTGLRSPKLKQNWSHLLIKEDPNYQQALEIYKRFFIDLVELEHAIDERNTNRVYKLQSFNPRYLECSVSV